MPESQFSTIAESARVMSRARVEHPVNLAPQSEIHHDSVVGKYLVLNYRSVIYRHVDIGRFCSIGRGCEVGVAQHSTSSLSTHGFQFDAGAFRHDPAYQFKREMFESHPPTTIGNDVWIGAQSIILSGVTVGDGAVIGANTVVRENVEPYAVIVGSPGRVVRHRFSENIIRQLLELRWWDLSLSVMKSLPFNDIEECISKLRQIRDIAPTIIPDLSRNL